MTIGSANFPENEILADIYADALKKAGVKVTTKLDIGSREVYFKETENGTLNVFPEYNGALLDYLDAVGDRLVDRRRGRRPGQGAALRPGGPQPVARPRTTTRSR